MLLLEIGLDWFLKATLVLKGLILTKYFLMLVVLNVPDYKLGLLVILS